MLEPFVESICFVVIGGLAVGVTRARRARGDVNHNGSSPKCGEGDAVTAGAQRNLHRMRAQRDTEEAKCYDYTRKERNACFARHNDFAETRKRTSTSVILVCTRTMWPLTLPASEIQAHVIASFECLGHNGLLRHMRMYRRSGYSA
jgi:hypothetical protein